MEHCAFFECLMYSPERCDKYDGCTGCPLLFNCDHCFRKITVVDGAEIPCGHAKESQTN